MKFRIHPIGARESQFLIVEADDEAGARRKFPMALYLATLKEWNAIDADRSIWKMAQCAARAPIEVAPA